MCIRDSDCHAYVCSGQCHGVLLFDAGHDGRREGVSGVGGCLLYTSDAADERSRGDLGGLRIIKKKKKTR